MDRILNDLKKEIGLLPQRSKLSARKVIKTLARFRAQSAADIAALVVDRSKASQVRIDACWALARVPFETALCYFIAALWDEPAVVWEATKGIIAKRDQTIVPILVSLVEHAQPTVVKSAAAYALG